RRTPACLAGGEWLPTPGSRPLHTKESARLDVGRPVPANEDLAESGLRRQELFPQMEGRASESILLPLGTRTLVLASRKETDQGDRIRRRKIRWATDQDLERRKIHLLVPTEGTRLGPGCLQEVDHRG